MLLFSICLMLLYLCKLFFGDYCLGVDALFYSYYVTFNYARKNNFLVILCEVVYLLLFFVWLIFVVVVTMVAFVMFNSFVVYLFLLSSFYLFLERGYLTEYLINWSYLVVYLWTHLWTYGKLYKGLRQLGWIWLG